MEQIINGPERSAARTSPKDFFLYLLSNVALYYCAGWLISLLYDYINYSFGSVDYYAYETSWLPSSMRWAMASLVIVFPVYILVTKRLNRDLETQPEKRGLWIRKWLIYLTLALASIAMVIDLVALVNQFLSGEFALTFFLKVLAVAVVAGMVFLYYFYELRRDAGQPAPARGMFRWIAIAIVAASVIGGFFIVGSPQSARDKQYDARRVSDLQSIQAQVVYYYQRKNALPTDTKQLADPLSGYYLPTDPETGADYPYRVNSSKSFDVCATFTTNASGFPADPMIATTHMGATDSYWDHTSGQVCFERNIDPELYPRIKN